MSFAAFAPAKINLYLHVHGRYEDGYHALESLVSFADCGDALHFLPRQEYALTVHGPFAKDAGNNVDNLITKAAQLFSAQWPGAHTGAFHLEKSIPVASGLGGGSADAAAALRLLHAANEKDINEMNPQIALDCGADVPVCVLSCAAQMRGKGEDITPVSLPTLYAVLVNCGVAVSTADVFRALQLPAAKPPLDIPRGVDGARLTAWLKDATTNNLTEAACVLCPEILNMVRALNQQNAALTRLSGSGATVFGLYPSRSSADEAARFISNAQPHWWVKSVTLRDQSVTVAEGVAGFNRT